MWGDDEDLSLWGENDVQERAGRPPAAVGSLSSARTSSTTLHVPSLPYASVRSSCTGKPMSLHELLRFLRDGAHAIRTFCRLYLVKVAGTPVVIQFEIGEASLKIKVRVTPDMHHRQRWREFGQGWRG